MSGESKGLDGHGEGCCCCNSTNNSVRQTLSEMDWERGIWYSALLGDKQRVKDLLDKDRDKVACAVDNAGYTALHYAARNGHVDICQMLLENGAKINAQTRCGKATPLHRAAAVGHIEAVKFLLKSGADPGIQDVDGQTALHRAADFGNLGIIELLVRTAPKLKEIKDLNGRVAFDFLPAIPGDESAM